MMHLRTFVPIVLLVSLVLLAAGCGKQPEQAADQPAAASTSESTDQSTTSVPTEAAAEPAAPAAESSDDEIVAYMNGRSLYREGLERELEYVVSQYAQIYAQFGQDLRSILTGASGRELKLNLELEALNRLAGREVLHEEAEKRGIGVEDAAVEAKFSELYAEFLDGYGMTEEEFETYVESSGSSIDEFFANSKKSVREQLLVEKLQEAVVGPIELTDEEVEAFFEENRSDYEQEEEVRASHILVDTQTEAEAIAERIRAGEDFAALAQEVSTCPSSSVGGDLGWFGRGQMVSEFEEAAFALNEGETSGIVETEYGFHIIRVTGRKEAASPTLAEIADQVRADAQEAAADEEFGAWYQDVYEAAEVAIEDPLFAAASLKNEDPEKGIEALEELLDDDRVDDPYVPYLLGVAYEERRQQAVTEKTKLEEGDVSDPEVAAQIAELEQRIEDATARALALYRRALETVGEDPGIRERLEIVEALATQTPTQTVP